MDYEYGAVQPWTADTSQQALARNVEAYVRIGWRVESAPVPGQVVMVHGKRPNHILHLLLSVVTFGLWLPVWLIVAATTREQRAVLTAHPDGTVANSLNAPGPPWYQQGSTWAALAALAVVLFIVWAS